MSDGEPKKNRKAKGATSSEVLSWRQKKATADEEEQSLAKEVEDIVTWYGFHNNLLEKAICSGATVEMLVRTVAVSTASIESMDEQQLRDFVLNRPPNMQSVKPGKGAPGKRVQRSKSKSSSASQGLMASVWKFHREDD